MRRILKVWCSAFLFALSALQVFASSAYAQEIILEEEDAKAIEKQMNDSRTCPGTEGFEIWSGCPKGGPQFWTGVFQRGVVAESGKFSEKIGFDGGLRFARRFDLGLGFGQMFKEGAEIQPDLRGRLFLIKFPQTGGPYLGGGLLLKTRQVGYFTLGFFGGSGLFFELQFRKSHRQPVAVVPSWGFRLLFL